MKNAPFRYVILLGGGDGRRSGLSLPKQFFPIDGKPLWEYTLLPFLSHGMIDRIIVVCHPDYIESYGQKLFESGHPKLFALLSGKSSRQENVREGLSVIMEDDAHVLVHDSARPFITQDVITRTFDALKEHSAVIPVVPLVDSLAALQEDHTTIRSVRRENFVNIQTPQGFHASVLKGAHEQSALQSEAPVLGEFTDDGSLVEYYTGCPLHTVAGEFGNIKITTPEDLLWAQFRLKTP